ncbi:MAG TPA: hypothetical protein VFB30_11110 [Spirochaetia bacterium]|nr:hypothetical protein [Spirochaetia bacterium]
MSFRKALFLLCLAASTACLAAAYAMIGSGWGTGLAILPCAFPLIHLRIPARWLPRAWLVSALCAAAVATASGATPHLMLPGAVLALAVWDLMNQDRAMAGTGCEKKHARSLALALCLGLLLAEGGAMLSLPLPFPVMLLLVILLVFSLSRVFRALTRDSEGTPVLPGR